MAILHEGAFEGAQVIKAASAEVLALYRDWVASEGLALFSALCRKDLLKLLRSAEAVQLIEACCTIGNYGDADDYAALDSAVVRLLKKDGVRRPKGKRAPPALVHLVEGVAPILVAYGVRAATGDNARMVLILLRVAAELEVQGDVRGVLRSLSRRHKAMRRQTRELLRGIIAAALGGRPMPED